MTDLSNDSPRRYVVDSAGRRVLVGLTIEETFEFETLDRLAALDGRNGHILWNGRDRAGPGRSAQRWRELYAKHEQAWSEWIAESRARSKRDSSFLN
jgi:hypothetical protein